LEAHMRTAWVVVAQGAAHDQERIGQAALLHGFLQGKLGLAGTELAVPDMGMGHCVIAGRRVGIQGRHIKSPASRIIVQALPEGLDGKGAQLHFFQGYGLGSDAEVSLLPVDIQKVEIKSQGQVKRAARRPTISLLMLSDAVAAGEGVLPTLRTRSFSRMTTSSTR